MRWFAAFVIVLLLTLPFVIAKGGSSGGSVVKPVVSTRPAQPECETFQTVKERVKCRLEFGQQKESVPEPCRVLAEKTACIDYYKAVVPCYDFDRSGAGKDACFRKIAGITEGSLRSQFAKDQKPVRYYILFLLYDLEEKVEDAQKEGKVTLTSAAELIEDIVEIKILLLQKRPAGEIREKMVSLRGRWPGVIA